MTRLMFDVAASSFAGNIALKQNAIIHSESHPKTYQALVHSLYVDDGLMGADSVNKVVQLWSELQ